MVVRCDDRVEAGSRVGSEQRQQRRQGAVAKVERDTEAGVLE